MNLNQRINPFHRSQRNTVISTPNGGSNLFNTPSHQGTIAGVINNSTSHPPSSTNGLTNHTDSSSIHQLQTSQTHPVTATSPGTATQISQQHQLNACEVVDNKSRQILINHRNDANVGVVSENYLHSPQQQVKVSHHHETKSEIRLEKETSGTNLTTNAVSLPSSGRKASIGDENGMITIVTINNNCNNMSESDQFGDAV
jgi:hypothetical protein